MGDLLWAAPGFAPQAQISGISFSFEAQPEAHDLLQAVAHTDTAPMRVEGRLRPSPDGYRVDGGVVQADRERAVFKVRIAAPANVPQADIHVTVNELVLSPALASDDRLTAALDSPLPYAFFVPGVIEAQVALVVGRLSVGHADFEAVRAVLSPRAATSSGKLEGADHA